MGQKKGMITDIQRTSVHDGPGLRTTVFLKGCNLHCAWCHNPETIRFQAEEVFYPEKCIHCGRCKEGCYAGARILCGKEYTVEEILDIVEEDKAYYGKDGGMTVSGGEPSAQPEFLMELVRKAKERGINTGIETNLSMNFDIYRKLIPYIDYWMTDIKIFDEEKHRKYTGISNKRIIENIKMLDDCLSHNLIVRTPVIKGVNDSQEELENIGKLVSGLNHLWYYELLPYHPLGLSKQVAYNTYIERFEVPDKEKLRKLAVHLKDSYKIEVRISNKAV